MTDEQYKTVLSIARQVDALSKRVSALEQPPVKVPLISHMGSGLEHTVEKQGRVGTMKFYVQFANAETISEGERMNKCEMFLRELEDLLRDYEVIKLNGEYHGANR